MDIEKPNCIGCHHIHPDNGNCTAVGGFCTAVPAANCPLIPELRAENEKMRAELERMEACIYYKAGGFCRYGGDDPANVCVLGPCANEVAAHEFFAETVAEKGGRDHPDPPDPLTQEQMREMDGQPVWDENGKCYLVDTTYRFCSCSDIEIAIVDKNGDVKRYPQRRALYRRPPEGEANGK